MPKRAIQTRVHEGNGHGPVLPGLPGKRKTLAEALCGCWRKTDAVSIGSKTYESSDEDETGSFADLSEEISDIKWLIPQWVPFGMLTGLLGHSKAGKSLWAMWAVVRPIITGCTWFSGSLRTAKGNVVWADTERRAAINLKRAKDWGLPVERIRTPFKDPKRPLNIDSQDDIDRLFGVVCKYRAEAVIVDSFRGAHRGDENSSRIVGPLDRLASIAEQTNTAMILIHHTGKLKPGEEINMNSARGSSAFLAAIACQVVIDQPNAKQIEHRRFRVLGENLGIAPKPRGFTISGQGLAITDAPGMDKPPTVKDKAKDWLSERMKADQWYPALTLIEEAKAFGFSGNALQRAREELGITLDTGLIRQNADGRYEWKLAGGQDNTQFPSILSFPREN